MTIPIAIDDAPQLALQVVFASLPVPLGELPSPPWLTALLQPEATAPLTPPEHAREAVRDLLRGHGYRPTGRGKPSSEYLVNAASDGRLGTINAVVDIGNAASLHSGLPISVVDLARTTPPLVVRRPPPGTSYVFNRGGQEIDVGGLLCLCDADGPCANAVKDAQRTKTDESTRDVLVLVWAPRALEHHAIRVQQWLHQLFADLGATPK